MGVNDVVIIANFASENGLIYVDWFLNSNEKRYLPFMWTHSPKVDERFSYFGDELIGSKTNISASVAWRLVGTTDNFPLGIA